MAVWVMVFNLYIPGARPTSRAGKSSSWKAGSLKKPEPPCPPMPLGPRDANAHKPADGMKTSGMQAPLRSLVAGRALMKLKIWNPGLKARSSPNKKTRRNRCRGPPGFLHLGLPWNMFGESVSENCRFSAKPLFLKRHYAITY
jgi:hypothetical protein